MPIQLTTTIDSTNHAAFITLKLGKVKVPSHTMIKLSQIVTEPFLAERVVFDGVQENIAFNLWLNDRPFLSVQALHVGDVTCLEIINNSNATFETIVRLIGRQLDRHASNPLF